MFVCLDVFVHLRYFIVIHGYLLYLIGLLNKRWWLQSCGRLSISDNCTFPLAFAAEALPAKICQSRFWRGSVTLGRHFKWQGMSSSNHCRCQKTKASTFHVFRNIDSTLCRFVIVHACDERTDGHGFRPPRPLASLSTHCENSEMVSS